MKATCCFGSTPSCITSRALTCWEIASASLLRRIGICVTHLPSLFLRYYCSLVVPQRAPCSTPSYSSPICHHRLWGTVAVRSYLGEHLVQHLATDPTWYHNWLYKTTDFIRLTLILVCCTTICCRHFTVIWSVIYNTAQMSVRLSVQCQHFQNLQGPRPLGWLTSMKLVTYSLWIWGHHF